MDWLWSAGVRGGEQFVVVFSDVSGAHFLQFGERFTRFAPSALTRSACGLRVKKKKKRKKKNREQVFFFLIIFSFPFPEKNHQKSKMDS